MSYIKGALIIILKDLERQILVLVNKVITPRLLRQRFKLKGENKPRVNLGYLVYYTLA